MLSISGLRRSYYAEHSVAARPRFQVLYDEGRGGAAYTDVVVVVERTAKTAAPRFGHACYAEQQPNQIN